eukprot:1365176-Alexandrium_andersonii.AAC.1
MCGHQGGRSGQAEMSQKSQSNSSDAGPGRAQDASSECAEALLAQEHCSGDFCLRGQLLRRLLLKKRTRRRGKGRAGVRS